MVGQTIFLIFYIYTACIILQMKVVIIFSLINWIYLYYMNIPAGGNHDSSKVETGIPECGSPQSFA